MAKKSTKDEVKEPPICYLRLSTGDEIIGECIGEEYDVDQGQFFVMVRSPMLMSEVTNPLTLGVSVALSKYIPLGEFPSLPINRANILFLVPVIPEMKELYKYSVHYSNEYVTPHVADELKQSTQNVKATIANEARDIDHSLSFEDLDKTQGNRLFVPSNTSLH